MKPLVVTREGKMDTEAVESYKSSRQALMAFMAGHVLGAEKGEIERIRLLEDEVATAFGTVPAQTLMITGGQSQADVNMSLVPAETDEAGLLVEQALVESDVTGSEQLLRFAKLVEGEYVLAPSGGPELGKFPYLTSEQNVFVALLNLVERCIYDDGQQTATELVPNLSAMVPPLEQAVLYATFLKESACYEMKEVSNKGVNKEGFPGLAEAAILGRDIEDLVHAAAEGGVDISEKLKGKRDAAKAMGSVFKDAMRYVDNVRQTVNIMNANGFTLIIDDQHAKEQPVFWLPRHELVQLRTYMVKFGFVRVTQLIAAMRSGNEEALTAAALEVSAYKPKKICFEGSFNQPAFKEVLFGPQAGLPFYRVMQVVTKKIEEELQKPIKVCIQGGWNVPVVPDVLKGEAAAPNAGAGVHVGSLAQRVKLGVKRIDLLPLGLPSKI